MNGLQQVKEALIEALNAAGLNAVPAFSPGWAKRCRHPVAAVGLRKGESSEVGLGRYLGRRTDEATGSEREVYGRALTMELSVDLYAPAESGAAGCDEALEKLHRVLLSALPCGLRPTGLKWEEMDWDEETELFLRKGSLRCEAWFTGEVSEDGLLLQDFILRGVLTK